MFTIFYREIKEERDNEIEVLICGGIGGGAQMTLAEAGIKLFGGVTGEADKTDLEGERNFLISRSVFVQKELLEWSEKLIRT